MKYFSHLVVVLKGMVIGVANIIPGVSGGTMAVVMGIYDRLLEAISGVVFEKGRRVSHAVFLAKVFSGAVIGIFALSELITRALTHYPVLTMLFFVGLILGSIPSVVRSSGVSRFGFWQIVWMSLGMLAVMLLGANPAAKASVVPGSADVVLLPLFLSMILAGGSMILPGVSGSLVMILLGQYAVILQVINQVRESISPSVQALFSGDFPGLWNALNVPNLMTLAVAGAGAVLGILVFSKMISWLLKKSSGNMYAFILGLVGGSIVVIYRGVPADVEGMLMASICLTSGSLLAWFSGSVQGVKN